MTLDGTNTWLLGDGVIVDPGPLIESHIDAICQTDVRLVLVTHHHHDHTAAVDALHERTGAPVRALDPLWCRAAQPLADGEELDGGIRVLATPGHTADSVSFVLGDAVVTGDTVLGRGTTVIADPDGDLAAYFDSLDRLQALGDLRVLPAHGDELPSIAVTAGEYRQHRLDRLDQVRRALAQAQMRPDSEGALDVVVEAVYSEVDSRIRMAVESIVRAQLRHLLLG